MKNKESVWKKKGCELIIENFFVNECKNTSGVIKFRIKEDQQIEKVFLVWVIHKISKIEYFRLYWVKLATKLWIDVDRNQEGNDSRTHRVSINGTLLRKQKTKVEKKKKKIKY